MLSPLSSLRGPGYQVTRGDLQSRLPRQPHLTVAIHWFDAEGNVGNRHLGGTFAVFEYMYRDAGNWKTHGALLLTGDAEGVREPLRKFLEWGDLFVAEQVGIPSLCDEHFAACGEGPTDLDHAYHEFRDLRPATEEEVACLPVAGALVDMVKRMEAVAGRWDVTLSPNCCL